MKKVSKEIKTERCFFPPGPHSPRRSVRPALMVSRLSRDALIDFLYPLLKLYSNLKFLFFLFSDCLFS
ncbi:MAG: hypothetical protein ACOCXH_10455, partial [Cyclobacteriaceae bacterium]